MGGLQLFPNNKWSYRVSNQSNTKPSRWKQTSVLIADTRSLFAQPWPVKTTTLKLSQGSPCLPDTRVVTAWAGMSLSSFSQTLSLNLIAPSSPHRHKVLCKWSFEKSNSICLIVCWILMFLCIKVKCSHTAKFILPVGRYYIQEKIRTPGSAVHQVLISALCWNKTGMGSCPLDHAVRSYLVKVRRWEGSQA
jgi:hypothetical protein